MPDAAGERYLRLLVERILAAGGRGRDGPATLANAGIALIAVGAVESDVVDQLRDDVALGLELRRTSPDAALLAAAVPRRRGEAGAGGAEVAAPTRVSPRAVATGPNHWETPEGALSVESISFGPDGATIVETLATDDGEDEPGPMRRVRRAATWPPSSHDLLRPLSSRRHRWRTDNAGDHRLIGPAARGTAPGVPPRVRPVGPGREQLRITDDQGHEYRRDPGTTGGGPGAWRWVSALRPAPDPATEWFEVAIGDSAAFRLAAGPAGGTARGRPQQRSPGASWLLGALQGAVAMALQDGSAPVTAGVSDGVDALLALGRLLPAEPLLQQLALLERHPNGASELDSSLASPLAGRDRHAGRRRATLALGSAIDLGSRSARLDVAILGERGLRLSGRFSPWDPGPIATSGWNLTGFDDRHNHYVATVAQCLDDPTGADVVWQLWPALDPAARSLRLQVAGPSLEASVEVVVE